MEPTTIRRVTDSDVAACHRIETAGFGPDEAATMEKIGFRQRTYPDGFLVAVQGETIAGFINSAATDTPDLANETIKDLQGHEPAGSHAVVLSLAVDPSMRGLGIAGVLLGHFISRSKKAGKHSILLLCKEDLIRFYEKFGFTDLGMSQSSHGGASWHEMALPLLSGTETAISDQGMDTARGAGKTSTGADT